MAAQNIPGADFGLVTVNPGKAGMPVGDPRLWANQVTTLVDDDPILTNTPRIITGNQIIAAAAADRYARSWSLSGAVTMPSAAWNGNVAPAVAPSFPDAGTSNRFEVWISVLQGLEMVTIEHLILLAVGGSPAFGLCNTQWSAQGGPYGATFTSPLAEQGQQSRAFAAIGSLIGNTISARAIFVRGSGGQIPSAAVALMVTPYAPGAGI